MRNENKESKKSNNQDDKFYLPTEIYSKKKKKIFSLGDLFINFKI